MLPRLQAEESFLASERVALGSGSLTSDAVRAVTRRWTQALGREARTPATPQALGAIGIGVRRVPRQARA